ncbi:MAG TPA: bifunctional demethylmenaquinone methyltransferase/2-methoxy-6-polyprenyl-1,4-benzoquinol methylase UbiE [Chitinophagales bacterium]|nr:bifunctional demethylmenaquinone methyltransferase/2-methoxy-6-polyprenyl-1,4-benzoquinol methylase UbiE [Chitinophagales bacterium]
MPQKDEVTDKKEQVRTMFDDIAARYDFLNNLLSLGIYKYWRSRLLKAAQPLPPNARILDVATGTGDIALALAKLKPLTIVGIDISEKMVALGKKKVKEAGLSELVFLQTGDAEDIHYPEERFNLVTVAYGVRNFANLERGLKEIFRVLVPGGKLLILEFTVPTNTLFSKLYRLYFTKVLPTVGGFVSANKDAYSYLPASVQAFPQGNAFLTILQQQGFAQAKCKLLTNGVVGLYSATKPLS